MTYVTRAPKVLDVVEGKSGHRVTVSRIVGPSGDSYQGHAICSCQWQLVTVMPDGARSAAQAHTKQHDAKPGDAA